MTHKDVAMHERTRRSICRMVFLLACVAPTCSVLLWAASRQLPGHVAAYQRELAERLDAKVGLAAVSHPRPGMAVLREFEIFDPESGAKWFTSPMIEAIDHGDEASISLTAAETTADGVRRLIAVLKRMLRSRGYPPIILRVDRLDLSDGPTDLTLNDVRLRIEADDKAARAVLAARLDAAKRESTIRLDVRRTHQPDARTTWHLSTEQARLPNRLAALVWPAAARLGAEADFRGTATLEESSGGWSCRVTGEFAGVDLATTIQGCCGHAMTGTAEIYVENADVVNGRLVSASGTILAGPGLFSRSLADAAARRLGFQTVLPVAPHEANIAYDRFGLALGLNSRGIVMRGVADSETQDAVLVGRYGALLKTVTPHHPLKSIPDLLQTAASESASLIPISPQTHRLSCVLPIGEDTR